MRRKRKDGVKHKGSMTRSTPTLDNGNGDGVRRLGHSTKYRPDMLQIVANLNPQTASRAHICVVLGVCRNTLKAWKQKDPAFAFEVDRKREERVAWLVDEAQTQVPGASNAGILHILKNEDKEGYGGREPDEEEDIKRRALTITYRLDMSPEQLRELRRLPIEERKQKVKLIEEGDVIDVIPETDK